MDPTEQPPSSTPDAPDQETMEQIRRRRLARLGGPPSRPATPAAGSPSTEAPPAENKTVPTAAEKPSPTETPRPKINVSPAPSATPQSTGSAATSRPGSTNNADSRAKRPASDVEGSPATAQPRKQTPAAQETIEDYADRVLSAIFRFTVDPSRAADSHGHKLTFLPNLSGELSEEGSPPKLSVDRLDEAIVEAATALPQDRPLFEYLLPCWKRVVRTLKLLRGPAPEREALLREARRLCFSNCVFALTVPELFG